MEIALIGAGISGLSLAFLIKKYLPNASIYIIDKNISGKIKTKILEFNNTKYFIELGPDSLVYNEKFNKINTEFNLDKLNITFSNNNPNFFINSIKLVLYIIVKSPIKISKLSQEGNEKIGNKIPLLLFISITNSPLLISII